MHAGGMANSARPSSSATSAMEGADLESGQVHPRRRPLPETLRPAHAPPQRRPPRRPASGPHITTHLTPPARSQHHARAPGAGARAWSPRPAPGSLPAGCTASAKREGRACRGRFAVPPASAPPPRSFSPMPPAGPAPGPRRPPSGGPAGIAPTPGPAPSRPAPARPAPGAPRTCCPPVPRVAHVRRGERGWSAGNGGGGGGRGGGPRGGAWGRHGEGGERGGEGTPGPPPPAPYAGRRWQMAPPPPPPGGGQGTRRLPRRGPGTCGGPRPRAAGFWGGLGTPPVGSAARTIRRFTGGGFWANLLGCTEILVAVGQG